MRQHSDTQSSDQSEFHPNFQPSSEQIIQTQFQQPLQSVSKSSKHKLQQVYDSVYHTPINPNKGVQRIQINQQIQKEIEKYQLALKQFEDLQEKKQQLQYELIDISNDLLRLEASVQAQEIFIKQISEKQNEAFQKFIAKDSTIKHNKQFQFIKVEPIKIEEPQKIFELPAQQYQAAIQLLKQSILNEITNYQQRIKTLSAQKQELTRKEIELRKHIQRSGENYGAKYYEQYLIGKQAYLEKLKKFNNKHFKNI